MKGWLGDSTKIFTAIMCLLVSAGLAFAGDFPGAKPNRQVIKTQQKVDKLFEKGDYERAFFIYRQELTPLGDKYAQYMVGYMTIVGKGTTQDFILGSAWYRLAAERGDKNFAKARDEILAYFNDEQMAMSDQRYAELRMQYSDAMIVARLVETDLEIVANGASATTLSYTATTGLAGSNPATDVATVNNAERAKLADEAKDRAANRIQFLRQAAALTEALSPEEKARIAQVLESAEKQGIKTKPASTTGSNARNEPRYASERYENYRPDKPESIISGNSERTLSPAPASP